MNQVRITMWSLQPAQGTFVLEKNLWDKWHKKWHSLLWTRCRSCHPSNGVKILKETQSTDSTRKNHSSFPNLLPDSWPKRLLPLRWHSNASTNQYYYLLFLFICSFQFRSAFNHCVITGFLNLTFIFKKPNPNPSPNLTYHFDLQTWSRRTSILNIHVKDCFVYKPLSSHTHIRPNALPRPSKSPVSRTKKYHLQPTFIW